MYSDYLRYKQQLEQTLNTVRAEFLGQNEKLTEYISDSAHMPPEVRADQVAQLLIIQLTRAVDLSDRDLCDGWRWLRAAALFLLERCPEEDHTFGKLITLASTDPETLALLDFSGWPAHYSRELANLPRAVKMGLEGAIWLLVGPVFSQLKRFEEAMLSFL